MSTIESLNTFKQLASVKAVATTNQVGVYYNGPTNNGIFSTLTYGLGTLTIDGVSILLNDYVLLTGQTDGSQNGIYQCVQQGLSGVPAVLQRRGDFQCIEQIRGGQYIPVSQGSSFAGSMWSVVSPFPLYIGFSVNNLNNINFLNVSEGGAGGPFLKVANNLSDVASVPASLVNLGLGVPTGTGNVVLQTSPTIITPLITGVVNGSNAPAGDLGEYVFSQVIEASGLALTSNVVRNLTSISLSAADWTVGGNLNFVVSGATPVAYEGWINTTSATSPDGSLTSFVTNDLTMGSTGFVVPTQRINVTTTTTVYISGFSIFSGGSVAINGTIYARRVR
jgi:hypothetical protein